LFVALQLLFNARLASHLRVCLAALALLAGTSSACADADVRWSFGWDGLAIVGRWTPATAEFTLPAAAVCQIEISTLDAEGHTSTFVSPPASLKAGSQSLTAFFRCGRLDNLVRVRLQIDGAVQATLALRPGQSGQLKELARLADRVIVTAGLPVRSDGPLGFEEVARPGTATEPAVHLLARPSPAELPTHPLSYSGVHVVVLGGAAETPEAVSQALREWVADGGRLLLSVPKDLATFRQSPLWSWLPVQLGGEPVAVVNLGELEALAGRSIRIPATGRQLVARLKAEEGTRLASSRDDPLLMRAPYGFGEVTVLAMDLTQPPLKEWGGLRDFAQRLVELPVETASSTGPRTAFRSNQLSSTGISDIASQTLAGLDHFPAVDRASPWWSMAWLLILLAVLGPLDYLLVQRVLHQPHATWVTLPVLLAAAVFFAARSGQSWNTAATQWNQLDVVDIDVQGGRFRQQTWGALYSAETAVHDLHLAGPLDGWTNRAESQFTPTRLSWFAAPETSFGGMYRPAGTEWNRTEYRIFPAEQKLAGLPTLQWSSRTITAEWTGQLVPPVTSSLHSTGLGRLTGTIEHRLPGELTDWVLAFGQRAYRRQQQRDDAAPLPLRPGERWSVEDPLTFQRELKGLLTRAVAIREQREGKDNIVIRTAQSRYDPLNRDLPAVWEMLTFHEAAGGASYTTLTNHLLATHDLSRQLDLGRAVLFGRLQTAPPAAVERNGQPSPPTRSDVLVRLVLPVERSGDILRELPRMKPEN
jgi:hypothetical protein